MKFDFRKWGNGSNIYGVSVATDYNATTKRTLFTSIGTVKKEGSLWIGTTDKEEVVGKSRKEVSEKLAALILK